MTGDETAFAAHIVDIARKIIKGEAKRGALYVIDGAPTPSAEVIRELGQISKWLHRDVKRGTYQ